MSFNNLKGGLYRLSQKSYLNRKFVLLFDILLSFLCCLFSILATNAITRYTLQGEDLPIFIGILIGNLVSILFFSLLFRSYRQLFRYSSMQIVRRGFVLILCTALVTILVTLLLFFCFARRLPLLEICYFCLFYLSCTYMLFVLGRYSLIMLARWTMENFEKNKQREKLLIYGVQEGSVAISRQLRGSRQYVVVGFCTRDAEKTNYQIDGLPIYNISSDKDLDRLVRKCMVDGVIFPAKHDFLHEKEGFIYLCESKKLPTYLMPTISESNSLEITKESIQRIRIEDLLMRDEIKNDLAPVKNVFADKVVLVTGAAGSIGSELVKQIAGLCCVKTLILFDNAETPLHNIRLYLEKNFPSLEMYPIIGDVRYKDRLEYVFERFHPQLVLHAAAYKHVPLMEENPCESVLVNVIGTKHLADLSLQYNVERMLMVSTDKAVNPTNVMGASKRAAEIYVQSLGYLISLGKRPEKTIFITTRFGNVLGSQGSVIELFRRQIAEGGPVTVTDPEVERFFMSIPEACGLVLQATAMAREAQIYLFDMGQKHKITDLAKNMIRLAGFEPERDIKIVYTGLRPGEKLYEEVLAKEENIDATTIDKIKIAKIRPMVYEEIKDTYTKLENLSRTIQLVETVKTLKQLVPEYISAHSQYETLDKNGTRI